MKISNMPRPKISWWLISFTALLFSVVVVNDLIADFQEGGRPWGQGDWLINNMPGLVRRGFIGQGLIWISDSFALDLLLVTIALQIFMSLIMIWFIWGCFQMVINRPERATVLFLPPFYPMMMVSDFNGMLFKDIIAISSLAVLTWSSFAPNRWGGIVLGCFLIVVAFFAHEALVLFLPVALYLLSKALKGASFYVISVGLTACAGAAFIFAATHSTGDAVAICDTLLTRGLDQHMCAGPIGHLNGSLAEAMAAVYEEKILTGLWLHYFFGYAVSVAVVAVLWNRSAKEMLIISVLTLMPFLPLFVVATDFGRWFSFAFMSLIFVTLVRGDAALKHPTFSYGVAACTVMVSLLITYDGTGGVYVSGLANRAASLLGL
ncbi:hypothetical protein N9L47_11820 [Rhodobacteraceae bacterium]|nr:hypothetical protein [Paracoccaceae bacterium]